MAYCIPNGQKKSTGLKRNKDNNKFSPLYGRQPAKKAGVSSYKGLIRLYTLCVGTVYFKDPAQKRQFGFLVNMNVFFKLNKSLNIYFYAFIIEYVVVIAW